MKHPDGRVFDCKAAGIGLIGAPAALIMRANCVSDARTKGFVPLDESLPSTTAKSTSRYTGKVTLSLPDGWEQNALNESMVIGNAILYATNRTTDTSVLLNATKREGITDLMEFAKTRRANQANRLTDPRQSEILQLEIAGRKALRFDVTGALKNGEKYTYMMTVIEGSTEIAIVNTWTSAANFERQKEAIELLTENVGGL